MVGRTITLLTACWGLTLLPNLCTAGVLVHPCECDSPEGCSHETECADDPCNTTAVIQKETTVRALEFLTLCIALPPDQFKVCDPAAALETPLPFGSQLSADRPFPDSDTPLRI